MAEQLGRIIHDASRETDPVYRDEWDVLPQWARDEYDRMAQALVAALHPTITTADELDALPPFSMIKSTNPDRDDDVWIKSPDGGGWYWWAYDFGDRASEVPLPAKLLYSPEPPR